ncbi:MAG TPA: hypothetical protein VFN66_09250 [Burkholderiales bacterium]|nr:hypothetical protein [Burkholderiales bacterium]
MGDSMVATKLDPNHTLFYYATSDCLNTNPKDLALPIEILETGSEVTKLYIIRGEAKTPLVSVKSIHLEPVVGVPNLVGPTPDQSAYTKAVLSEQNHRFQSVTASVIPYAMWATSEQSRNYFGQFASVAIAKIGEASPVSGWPNQDVRFPFYLERAYKRVDGRITDLEKKELVYRENSFEVPSESSNHVKTFYSATEMEASSKALVSYKGTIINVFGYSGTS